jgi:hypothetical protein
MTKITVTLNFGKYKHCLWTTTCKNFIKKYPERFVLLEGSACTTGFMYFCNTYLEAQFVMALEEGVALYADEANTKVFIVVSEKEYIKGE